MIVEYIDRFKEIENQLKEKYIENKPTGYYDAILKDTLELMFIDEEYGTPDFTNIHRVDDGDYQGTLLFIVPERCYQPNKYWIVKVSYGSCSHCDTYQSIDEISDVREKSSQFTTLALHMIESMKEI